jgi:hypothetical protein
LRGHTKEYFREKYCFLKKGCRIWAFDGSMDVLEEIKIRNGDG